MLNKKDFLKYASTLAFPIMLQNLIGTLVNIADTVMLGYVSQTAMSASSLANQYTFILFCLYYGMATGTSVLCAQYWGKGDKKTVEKILGLAERISLIISLIFFVISFTMPTAIMKIFTNSPETIAAGSEYLKVISFSFVFMGFSQIFMSALRSIGKIMLPSVTYIVSLCVVAVLLSLRKILTVVRNNKMKKGENNDRFLLLGLMCILYLEINVIKTVHQ